jgi:hypothetical protein
VSFKIKKYRPLFTIKVKNVNFKTRDFGPLIERVLAGVWRREEAKMILKTCDVVYEGYLL